MTKNSSRKITSGTILFITSMIGATICIFSTIMVCIIGYMSQQANLWLWLAASGLAYFWISALIGCARGLINSYQPTG